MFQWHPLFAHLLRPVLQDAYEVQTNVPVGDLPREADILVVRRVAGRPRYHGVWRHLTPLNVLELKGRTESARGEHLDLLLEVGLGMRRRTNEQRGREELPALRPAEVSFWYLARHFGRRFLQLAERRLGPLEAIESGLWRARVLDHPIWLVSGQAVALERDNLPVVLVNREGPLRGTPIAAWVLDQPGWLAAYGPWLAVFYERLWEEVIDMAIKRGDQKPPYSFKNAIKLIGLKGLIEQAGEKELLEEMGPKRVVEVMGTQEVIDELLGKLTPAERAALRRRLE